MKTSALLLLILICANARATDIRIVSGREVDIEPLITWKEKRRGERPLPHWQFILIAERKGAVGGYERVATGGGSSAPKELLISNCPLTTKAFLDSLEKQSTLVKSLAQQVKQEEAEEEKWRNLWIVAGSGVSVTVSSRKPTEVDSSDARYVKYIAAGKRLRAAEDRLSDAKAELRNLTRARDEEAVIVAMFTGKKYGSFEIWDCGKKKP